MLQQSRAEQVLQDASTKASASLRAACQPGEVMTPPARMAAVRKRLDTMLEGVKSVRAALEDFYATLNDEQKAQFEAIGPRRTS
ncbi:LTXXQ motif family protein [Bradyrhizobium stylosanthis]|uniref:LTXXQ motif family protein n=1 Tax=Bradyrhizobium stylosanthis TaxID=1803665 RepID=A0A560DMU5_9BRAD|nr:LTXXQ motif family protein [Bradyrhizobium stylosanthis]